MMLTTKLVMIIAAVPYCLTTAILAKEGYTLVPVLEDAQPLKDQNAVLYEGKVCDKYCCHTLFKDNCPYPGCRFWTNEWTTYVVSPNKVIECSKTKRVTKCHNGYDHFSEYDGSTVTYRFMKAADGEVALLDTEEYVGQDNRHVRVCDACTLNRSVIIEDNISCTICGMVQISKDFRNKCPALPTTVPTTSPSMKEFESLPAKPTPKPTRCPVSNDFPCPTPGPRTL